MAKKTIKDLSDYITPLRMNSLRGRMLHVPPKGRKKKEILLVYGHHSSIERMFGLVEYLNQYGAVTVPDLPGFGGMQSFYHLKEKPTVDNLADYLAAFVKLRYKRKRLVIVAMSFGFVITTKMLQKYPELAKKVDILVSFVGFTHKTDIALSRPKVLALRTMTFVCKTRLASALIRRTILTAPFLRFIYQLTSEQHHKFKDANKDIQGRRIDFEIKLWQANDLRTHMYTFGQMFRVDLCDRQVDLPVHHVKVRKDGYLDAYVVEQHLRVIYKDLKKYTSKLSVHAPTVIATKREIAPFIPSKLRQVIAKS